MARADTAQGEWVAPGRLLERVSGELDVLAQTCEALGLLGAEPATADEMRLAQSHDLTVQTLQELSRFLRQAATCMDDLPPRDVSQALGETRLGALAARLAGNQGERLPLSQSDVELF